MKIDQKGLAVVLQELDSLDGKDNLEKRDKDRRISLLAQAAAIRSGAKLKDIIRRDHNERARANGLNQLPEEPTKQERRARGWQHVIRNGVLQPEQLIELRDSTEGNVIEQIGTYTDLGYFVPTGFYPKIFRALKEHDALFDEDVVTLIQSKNGRPLPVPIYGDTENVATTIAESDTSSETDIAATGHAVLGAWTYRTPRYAVSLEAFDDLEPAITVVGMFKDFATDRFARGFGADLVTGSGSSKPLGLIPSLLTAGITPIIATGSAANDGSENTGANSIGSADLAAMFNALDPAYMKSPKVRWLMNLSTFANLLNLSDKNGRPLDIVKYENGTPTIYGIKIAIAPSMPSIGASDNVLILGDFSYWATRLVVDMEKGPFGIMVYRDSPGYAEYGKVGLRAFFRGDGALLWNDSGSPCPFVMLQQHS